MPRKSTGAYPENWKEIARAVKEEAGWKCVRCNQEHNPGIGYTLTVHHLDMCPTHNAWHNLVSLCQRCHLQIQHKVVMEQPYMFPHSTWFQPYVAAYYGVVEGVLPQTYNYFDSLILVRREFVMSNLDYLLSLGSVLTLIPGTSHFEEAW